MRGNKAPLIERLNAAREKKLCYLPPQQVDNPEINKLANDGFLPLARWEMLKIEKDAPVLEDKLEVDGIKYLSPTVPREEFKRTGEGAVVRRSIILGRGLIGLHIKRRFCIQSLPTEESFLVIKRQMIHCTRRR